MADLQLTSSEAKCPLHSRDGTNPENAALSKSKKKRLRKKKKIEEEVAQKKKEVGVEASEETSKIPLGTSSKEPPSYSAQKKKNQSGSFSVKAPNTSAESAACSKETNSVEFSSVLDKCNNKSKEGCDDRNSDTLKKSAINSSVERELPCVGKIEIDAPCETVRPQAKMDSKPSRDDVMAQREAKKLAKLAKKNKSGGDALPSTGKDVSSNEPAKENISTTLNSTKTQNPAPVKSPVASKPSKDERPPVSGTMAVSSHAEKGETPSGKAEKTREEILAEREAKKQAKLAAKNKKKDPSQPGDSSNVVPPAGAVSAKKENPVGETVAARSSSNDKPETVQENPVSGTAGGKSKAQLRAERREKQEAQRAAKGAAKKEADIAKPQPGTPSTKPGAKEKTSASKPPCKPPLQTPKPAKSVSHQPKLLSHLETDTRPLPSHIYQNVHPAIVELGAKYAARVVSGSNARCIALLHAVKKVIADFITPREKEFSRAMESRLNDSMAYLNASRPSSVSMTNALKHVKSHLTQLATEKATTDDEARRKLFEVIDTFIKEQIDVAGQAICNAIAKKISNGDTIAIYGCSSLLLRILVESRSEGKDFEVVVVDGGPLYEGREMCRRLVAENIRCCYVLLPAFSYVVGQTNKVLLGAHALLANGCVMSRSGTALVAMLAKAHNVPVIVCCETYKFCERVQADAFVHNELGPQHGSGTPPLISLMYDMTPPTLVDAVATELAILPCTSVPVVLRVKPSDVSSYYY